MTSIDLMKPSTSGRTIDHQLDAKELEVLRDAGILGGPSRGRRRKAKHVVFVDSREQGVLHRPCDLHALLSIRSKTVRCSAERSIE
jgi:hypothetical protein